MTGLRDQVDEPPNEVVMNSVVTPTVGVDPRVAVATSMHAAPGIYAVLVGSGMSSAAGVPTGWQVVQDLIRKVGLAEGADPTDLVNSPEAWWLRHGRGEARYDGLLTALAPTDATRQAMLRNYFDPQPGAEGPVLPTAAHDALAKLCATGRVKLIVTTNFDRLIERALDRAGISAQIIASREAVRGMIPLSHAPVTLLKLHGDYASPGLRNTPEELASYPDEWRDLLARVFDEFGMVVIGWSAEYDTALREAFVSSPSRRYPAYWTTLRGSLAEDAQRLITLRQASVIDTAGADEFLSDLAQRIERLDQVAARRMRPTALRHYMYSPEQGSPPQGWAVLPLLQLRAVAIVSPATVDTSGLFRPEQRDALTAGLDAAQVTSRLRHLSAAPALNAIAGAAADEVVPLESWVATPGAHQSTEHCSYRPGGDASAGVSALVTVSLPGYGSAGGSIVIRFDVALSLSSALDLAEACRILSGGLVLATDVIPDALADVIPADAEVTHAELHVLAAQRPGTADHPFNQPNDVLTRINLATLGAPPPNPGPSFGFAAQLMGRLTDQQAAELTVQAIDYMALASGWLDPRAGIIELRRELGVA